jgi:predicted GH43/DUF377 family glycosyl hydrolase
MKPGFSVMARFEGNPILSPVPSHPWESRYVFNPAMFELGNRIHYIYRAMGGEMISRLGYASSTDGCIIDERLPHPIFEPATPEEVRGVEDPRVTIMGDKCIMTYTAFAATSQIGITTIKSKDLLEKKWNWSERIYPFPGITNKNAALFPEKIDEKFVMFHRIDPDLWIAYSDDMKSWFDSKKIMGPRPNNWDCIKVGIAGPPIEIDEGWLQIYHGVDERRVYRLGALILNKDYPEEIIYRSQDPILEPCEEYECRGFVPNVVFSCGAVRKGDWIKLSYGASDTVIAVTEFSLDDILSPFRK